MASNSNSLSNHSFSNFRPFENSSYQNQSDHNPMLYCEVGGNYCSIIHEEDNHTFLNNTTISLKTKYNKCRDEADVNYIKINTQENNNNEQIKDLTIENIKEINPENYSGYFRKFLKFIKNVESELKLQNKCEEEIEIYLKFIEESKDNMKCEYEIKNKISDEYLFKDENILNNCDLYGLGFLLDALNRY